MIALTETKGKQRSTKGVEPVVAGLFEAVHVAFDAKSKNGVDVTIWSGCKL